MIRITIHSMQVPEGSPMHLILPSALVVDPDRVAARAKEVCTLHFGGNQTEMARRIGWSQPSLSRALNRLTKSEQPYEELARAIAARLPYSFDALAGAESLLPGQGDGGQGEIPQPPPAREPSPGPEANQLVRIQHLSVEASAGDGAEVYFEEVNGETFLPAWYVWQEFGVAPERLKRIRVHGDSMAGTVEPGQLVYVVMLEPGQQPVHGGVYVLRGPHGLLIKRLYFDDESTVSEEGEVVSRRYVRIHSDNPAAGTYRVPLEVFERDYRAIAHFRRVESYI